MTGEAEEVEGPSWLWSQSSGGYVTTQRRRAEPVVCLVHSTCLAPVEPHLNYPIQPGGCVPWAKFHSLQLVFEPWGWLGKWGLPSTLKCL
jgi:hypothetical protein